MSSSHCRVGSPFPTALRSVHSASSWAAPASYCPCREESLFRLRGVGQGSRQGIHAGSEAEGRWPRGRHLPFHLTEILLPPCTPVVAPEHPRKGRCGHYTCGGSRIRWVCTRRTGDFDGSSHWLRSRCGDEAVTRSVSEAVTRWPKAPKSWVLRLKSRT